jgi:uncharacterized protein YrrD
MTTIPIEDVKEWFGKDVIDTEGEKLGKLEDVLYDAEADAPAFAAVKSGTFSKHLTLVSLDGASAGQSHLRVPVDKQRFKKAPSFDPDAELSLEDEASAYGYYGLEYRPVGDGARRLAKH